MSWMLCASGCLSVLAPVISITASLTGLYFTITKLDDITVYSRECGFADLLIWFPGEGYRDRWTDQEIKDLLAVNTTLDARCKDAP